MEYIDKIVEFDKYCKKCEYNDVEEFKDPCHDCLNNPVNTNSHKPINFKENKNKNKKG